jgi:hypothetical protein
MALGIHADAEATWHGHLRVSTQAEVHKNQAQMEKSKMKPPVIKAPARVRNTMGSRVRKGLAAITALGTRKG